MQLAPLHRIVGEAAVLEVVEEGCEPVALFNGVSCDGVDFIFLWNELQDGREKPSLLNGDLCDISLRKNKRSSKLRQGIGRCIPASWNVNNFNTFEFLHELPGCLVVWHQLRLPDFIDFIDLPNNELRVSMNSQRTYLHGEGEEKPEDECLVLRLVVGALFF